MIGFASMHWNSFSHYLFTSELFKRFDIFICDLNVLDACTPPFKIPDTLSAMLWFINIFLVLVDHPFQNPCCQLPSIFACMDHKRN